jgi:hypothetical protein
MKIDGPLERREEEVVGMNPWLRWTRKPHAIIQRAIDIVKDG